MSESTKKQPYTYTLKTATFIGGDNGFGGDYGYICSNGIIFYLVPPDGALTIENLWVHIFMEFDSSIAVGKRVLKKIGIIDTDASPTLFPSLIDRLKVFDVNISADANRQIDKRIDLSALLKKDNIAYRNLFADSSTPDNGYTMVYLGFDDSLAETSIIGKVKLWKTDALFTTIGIV
jgi:hypothetical protein